jgi:hypothetical protein
MKALKEDDSHIMGFGRGTPLERTRRRGIF